MIEFFKKYKATIISVLTAILSLAVGLSGINLGAKVGVIIAILVVVIPVFINLLTDGFNDKTVDLIVNAVSIIQEIIVNNNSVSVVGIGEETSNIESEENNNSPTIFTKEEIREMLLQSVK